MIAPRIYWLCTHQTLRYEEIPLLIEAGAEVIPCLGDRFWLKFDSRYDDETDRLYPHWRKSCTLPTNIVEQIRRINILGKKGNLSTEEAKLINQWIDCIFVSNYPEILQNISKWFHGYIVFRVFGHGDYTTYTEQMNRLHVDIGQITASERYVWCPILHSLDDREDKRIIKNKFYLNAFVSKERLEFAWKGPFSKPYVSTTISYLDSNPAARGIFENFINEFQEIPFVVLGKNSKNAVKGISDKILGHLDDLSFYSKITESRIFVYFGLGSNYHLHYTPIEAIEMGVPVVFLEKSGLAQEARDHGINDNELKKIGMCANPKEIKQFVLSKMNNIQALQNLANDQSNVFGKIFSRQAALTRTKIFFRRIRPYIRERRKEERAQTTIANLSKNTLFRSPDIQTDLPVIMGQRTVFSMENISGTTGKMIYDHKGEFIAKRAEKGSDPVGMLIGQYIQKMSHGRYSFSLELISGQSFPSSVGVFSIGVWNPEFQLIRSTAVSNLKQGKNIVAFSAEISQQTAELLKEIRFVWNGNHTFELKNLIVEKLD